MCGQFRIHVRISVRPQVSPVPASLRRVAAFNLAWRGGVACVAAASGPWPSERLSGRPHCGHRFRAVANGETLRAPTRFLFVPRCRWIHPSGGVSRKSRCVNPSSCPTLSELHIGSSQMPTLRDAAFGCIRIMDTPLYDEHEASSSPPSGSPPPSLPPSPVRKSRHPKLTHEHAITKRRARAPLLCRPRSLLTSIRRRQMRSRAPHRPS